MTEPTKKLFDPNPGTQLKYVNHAETDIRILFERVRAELKPVASKNVRQLKQKGK